MVLCFNLHSLNKTLNGYFKRIESVYKITKNLKS